MNTLLKVGRANIVGVNQHYPSIRTSDTEIEVVERASLDVDFNCYATQCACPYALSLKYCSPRHRIPSDLRKQGLKMRWMTWRAISARPSVEIVSREEEDEEGSQHDKDEEDEEEEEEGEAGAYTPPLFGLT